MTESFYYIPACERGIVGTITRHSGSPCSFRWWHEIPTPCGYTTITILIGPFSFEVDEIDEIDFMTNPISD